VEAARLYEIAAGLGNMNSMHNLGLTLARGEGIPRDDAAAARWFMKATMLGNEESLSVMMKALNECGL
jgi:TPR repeat protein